MKNYQEPWGPEEHVRNAITELFESLRYSFSTEARDVFHLLAALSLMPVVKKTGHFRDLSSYWTSFSSENRRDFPQEPEVNMESSTKNKERKKSNKKKKKESTEKKRVGVRLAADCDDTLCYARREVQEKKPNGV